MPIRNSRWVKAKLVKDAKGIGSEAIATTFVAWERGFVYHGHIVAKTVKGGGTGSSGGTCTDN